MAVPGFNIRALSLTLSASVDLIGIWNIMTCTCRFGQVAVHVYKSDERFLHARQQTLTVFV